MKVANIIAATTITAVWIALGGAPPTKHGRALAFYRDGDNREAVSLNNQKGCWYDFVTGAGGGVLSLIQHVLGCSKGAAARWLADLNGLVLDNRPYTGAERRQYGRLRARAERLAQDVADFALGIELSLRNRQRRAALVVEGLLQHDEDPDEILFNANRDLEALLKADADSLVRTYSELPESPRRRFIEAGRHDRQNADAITQAIVDILARTASLRTEDVEA
jgi:hypothetical protein